MIVQCEACQTRFRLADEKVKPGGTKVRCSKCKEVFSVMPAEPEPEPAAEPAAQATPATAPEPAAEPAAEPTDESTGETIDFGSFNMEKVEDEPADEAGQQPLGETQDAAGADELDFSGLETDLGEGGGEELADDFSFADTSQATDEEEQDADATDDAVASAFTEETEETEETAEESATEPAEDGMEFDFGGETATEEGASSEEPDTPAADEAPDFFAGEGDEEEGDAGEAGEFSFDDTPAQEPADEPAAADQFSVDDDNPFGDDSEPEWGDESAGDGDSFDFEEPSFGSEEPAAPSVETGEEGGLHFGEIDFAGDSEAADTPDFETDDFAGATMESEEQEAAPQAYVEQQRNESAPPPRREREEEPLPVPPRKKKSALSKVLVLLLLLLLALGGGAGYLFMQEGTLNLSTVVRYLPFLKDYIGSPADEAPGARIGIEIAGSSYVDGKQGQLLVIQGAAINNYTSIRSTITVKGILLDANDRTLLQQTVYCGNPLDDNALRSTPFKAIEEAMNNPFGDTFSNMNVAPGARVPFTIVFRNLPQGIANINVEVVSSEPGAG